MSDTISGQEAGFGGSGQGGGGPEGDAGDDGLRLIAFLKTLDKDLQAMIANPGFMSEDLRALASRAYDAGGAPQVSAMIRMLERDWDDHVDALAHHGLTGVQLDFKLKVHGQARDLYLSPPPAGPGPFVIENDGTLTDVSSEEWADAAAKDYLDCSDIILESLSGALGGAGAALIEIKKMIEWLKGAGARWARRLFFR